MRDELEGEQDPKSWEERWNVEYCMAPDAEIVALGHSFSNTEACFHHSIYAGGFCIRSDRFAFLTAPILLLSSSSLRLSNVIHHADL